MTRPVKNPSKAKAVKMYRDKIKRTNPDLHEARQEAKRASGKVSAANLSAFLKGERNPITNPNITVSNHVLIPKLSEPSQKEFFRVVDEFKNKNKSETGNQQTYFQNEIDRLCDEPEFEEDFDKVSALNFINLSKNWNSNLSYVTKGRRKYRFIDSKQGTSKAGRKSQDVKKKTTPEKATEESDRKRSAEDIMSDDEVMPVSSSKGSSGC